MTMLTVWQLAALPLYDRAYYELHGRLPDGRLVMGSWQRPDGAVIEYVETLQEALIRCAEVAGVDGEAIAAARSGAMKHPSVAEFAVEAVAQLRRDYDDDRAPECPLATLRSRASSEPLGVDISDYGDEWVLGFLAGQVNALDEYARAALEGAKP